MEFIGNRDVDMLILTYLDAYDLYQFCNSSKNLLPLCKQNKLLKERYLHVHKIVQEVTFYYKNLDRLIYKEYSKYIPLNIFKAMDIPDLKDAIDFNEEVINLFQYFPHLSNYYNRTIEVAILYIGDELITIGSLNGTDPNFTIHLSDDGVIDFLIKLCLLYDDFYKEILNKNKSLGRK